MADVENRLPCSINVINSLLAGCFRALLNELRRNRRLTAATCVIDKLMFHFRRVRATLSIAAEGKSVSAMRIINITIFY